MKTGFIIFTFFLIFSLTYNFYSYSQNSKEKIVKSCSETVRLVSVRKSYLENSIKLRKQKNSDIFSSLKNLEGKLKINKPMQEEFDKFYQESDVLILEREDLVSKLDSILKLDCEKDKKSYLTKLNIFNNNYKNHLRKENKIREDFEENIMLKLEGVKNETN